MWKWLLLTSCLTAKAMELVETEPQQHSFSIDTENNQFLLDGEPFRYVSGSLHYFRVPKELWRDRLRKFRAAGLNAISTYVEWSLHEPEPGQWRWTDDADLVEFINLAQQEDLLVLLRPGPYICAERDLGGLPYWLLSLVPDIKLRTNDERYMGYVRIYINELMKRVKPYLRGNGGPVIMVQVENEYGSFGACDRQYMTNLHNLLNEQIGSNAVLYTTDGAIQYMLQCGVVPGAYVTVDFGVSSNVTEAFQTMRLFQPRGPLVNSEFYPGWLTHWEEPYQTIETSKVANKLDQMLAMGASVNIYVFHGGTNFGFTSGANTGASFSPQLTSYDYDAPLTEAGDPTPKYFKIREIISKYLPMPNVSLPSPSPKGNYGSVTMNPVIGLFDPTSRRLFGTEQNVSNTPPTFESLRMPLSLVLYETNLPQRGSDPGLLKAPIRDRALIYVNQRRLGILSRTKKIFKIPMDDYTGKSLKVLVENQGHVNYGNEMEDFKGAGNVTLNNVALFPWNVTGFRLDNVSSLHTLPPGESEEGILHRGPCFFRGIFTVSGDPLDTFLDTSGWGKGVAYVNNRNLGRYWPQAGPQITLYVPAPFLSTGENELVLLEFEHVPSTRMIRFQTVPNMDINQVPRKS